tara:strand:+ start:10314 stop:11345 length:1032 start_codon:yes stop_codon:yes gene_type:complete
MNFNKNKNIIFEDLHIRHLNLLIDLKNEKENSWFYKMAILNTLNDLRIILNSLDGTKNKCIIAIQDNKIIGYVHTYPLNEKKTCLKINAPSFINHEFTLSKRELILKLIQNSIINTDFNTASWVINSEIDDKDLISCSRELGFQPIQEIKLWSIDNKINEYKNNLLDINRDDFIEIKKSNLKKFLNFIRSSESIILRNILDLEQQDIVKRNDKLSGGIIKDNNLILVILKDISYTNKNVYSLIRGVSWDERIELQINNFIKYCLTKDKYIQFKTSSTDNDLNNCLKNFGLIESENQLLLVRNTFIKREQKSSNKLNKSIESIIKKINPQGNTYPSPSPYPYKF